jgi:hypothetical protein
MTPIMVRAPEAAASVVALAAQAPEAAASVVVTAAALVAAALAAAAVTAAALAEDKKNRKGTVWAVPFFRSLWLLFPRCLSTQKWGRGQLGQVAPDHRECRPGRR